MNAVGIFILILLFGFIDIQYKKFRDDKRLVMKLKDGWNEVPECVDTANKLPEVRKFYDKVKSAPGDLDDITWNDLEMDEIFLLMNNTCSAAGEECLYSLLRKPVCSKEKLQERKRLMDFFAENEEERLKLQKQFTGMGKIQSFSVYEYLELLKNVKRKSILPDLACTAGIFVSIGVCLFSPAVGGTLFFLLFINSMFQYFKNKKDAQNYFIVAAYAVKMAKCGRKIAKLHIPEIKQYTDLILEKEVDFKPFLKGSWMIEGAEEVKDSLGIIQMLLDILRMFFHIDVIKLQLMVKFIKENPNVLNELFEAVGYLDAIIGTASFKGIFPVTCTPDFIESSSPVLELENVYHPFITHPVVNSIRTSGPVLITGSNASGKSTFLKTVALNAVLCQTIYTGFCTRCKSSFFHIYTSMALRDNLANQESYYIVEIKSLKRIMDADKTHVPVLCFVDEVLRGTNTLERIAASSQILYEMSKDNVLCFAATHDIELTNILEKHYRNFHFEEQVNDSDITFDYKLREGRAVTRNAIKLLKLLGYPDKVTNAAEENADHFIKEEKWRMFA